MTKQEKLKLVADAYISKKVDDSREQITIINESLPEEFQKAIKDVQYRLHEDTGTFELDYEIMADACSFVGDMDIETLEKSDEFNDTVADETFASVYTGARLTYLCNINQDEITSLVKEYGCDIADACAYWYDDKVRNAIYMLQDYILAK